MDGIVSTLEMRRFEKEKGIAPATIVALTGISSIKAREKIIASGVDKVFTKPMPLASVKELLLQAGLGRDA
jgi:AmiR/NasT family two-component response regulator